jgi:diaminohydroxyphosphoribosylaminopyrimidine deaminase/5-amino-6-(5-phosphoribosylamino)uracil reductase
MVGAVVVKQGRIIGEGFHHKAGEPHAEVFALRQCGESARGATIYVNLEPCCHYGRTPPCTEALISAGVKEVHAAMLDPNPRVSGQGLACLEKAGIRTVVGEHEAEARNLNEVFINWITTGLPFVIAKFAMSLDGKIATHTGDSRWITGELAREYVHRLRNQVDAILIGVSTVIADDPRLTTRLDEQSLRHPLRIILDSHGRIPLKARVLDPALPGRTLIATTETISPDHRQALLGTGAEVLALPEVAGRVDLRSLLNEFGKREITSVLVEGGGTVLGEFFSQRLINKVLAFVAPIIIGGKEAPPPIGGLGISALSQAMRLDPVATQWFGTDLLFSAYPASNGLTAGKMRTAI